MIWVHAVSVGEILSLRGLLDRIRSDFPAWSICVSTLTETGYRTAIQRLTAADRVFFIPFDFDLLHRRMLARLKPDILVLAESEFWPNMLRAARRRVRSILVVNGRISRRSHRSYRRLQPWIRRALLPVDFFLMQTPEDLRRLLDLGPGEDQAAVAGNLKAEIDLPKLSDEEKQRFRFELGVPSGTVIWTVGSSHRGEEVPLLKSYAQALAQKAELRLILAPRHPHRAEEVARIARAIGLRAARRTRLAEKAEWDVLILDTIGELAQIYALSHAAFLGGSLVRHGGQNLLEPAFYSRPIFFGPHMDNFANLAELFVEKQAARVVRESGLVKMFLGSDDLELEAMGRRAGETLASLRGGLDRTLAAIKKAARGI